MASEAAFSVFIAALFKPRKLFENMPQATSLADNARLMAIFMSLPLIMASMLTGIISAIIILPVGIAAGLGTSWLWAAWLAWAARKFTGREIYTPDTFQVCAYSAPPLAISWGPYLGLPMALWNLWLNWRGLTTHLSLGGWQAFLLILAGLSGMSLLMLPITALLIYLLPENTAMLIELLQLWMK